MHQEQEDGNSYPVDLPKSPCRMNMKEYLAFDWGGTFLKYALMNENTEIIEQGKVPTPPRTSTIEEFMEVIDSIVNRYLDRISGIAISSPGILDSTRGIIHVVGVFPFLAEWNLTEEFEKRYGVRTSLENDAKSAALAELWRGNLAGVESGAVWIIGTSVGGGLVFDGKLRRGKDFFAGEFSAMNMNCTEPAADESYVAQLGVRALLQNVGAKTGEDPKSLTGEIVFDRINAGDADAVAALEEYTDAMALQLFNLNVLLNLDRICIGGGISRQPKLMEFLKKSIQKVRTYHPDMVGGLELPLPSVEVCRFFNDANLIGALYHFMYE